MGKKIPYDQALKTAHSEPNDSIFAKPNKYGYQININHPKIRPMYERYKEKLGERILSDKQRFDFERLIFELIRRKNHEQSNTDGTADG
ncbi:MAG: hypothetical protein IJ779_03540 [Ruminococcus sp.]|nr:hypothetical protein [Ruminococcus sp.]